jgi:hypothetical protein
MTTDSESGEPEFPERADAVRLAQKQQGVAEAATIYALIYVGDQIARVADHLAAEREAEQAAASKRRP